MLLVSKTSTRLALKGVKKVIRGHIKVHEKNVCK